jgi:PLP dependent protein
VFDSAALRARLSLVRDRIARAAGRAGRDPASIRLVAVSKTFSPDHVRAAADAGQLDFGENKIQEALAKMQAIADLPLRWHMIGHLQSNKARKVTAFHALHGIDSIDLLDKVDQAVLAAATHPDVLIQVDLAREATKFGALPDAVPAIAAAAAARAGVRLAGLMTLPPAVENPDDARPYFARLRALRDELVSRGVPAAQLRELSMGMSHDFEAAIEEGATLVRVGSAIFGERSYGD